MTTTFSDACVYSFPNGLMQQGKDFRRAILQMHVSIFHSVLHEDYFFAHNLKKKKKFKNQVTTDAQIWEAHIYER
jgi:hypothetical protein